MAAWDAVSVLQRAAGCDLVGLSMAFQVRAGEFVAPGQSTIGIGDLEQALHEVLTHSGKGILKPDASSAGGGMVKVVANGRQQILSIQIEKEVVDPEDIEMLQDLILLAVNEALKKSQEMVASEMSKLTGGLNIPGIM